MNEFNFEKTFQAFREKCVESEQHEKDWQDTIDYIEEYSLAHEVFMSASHSYRSDMTRQEAVDAICIAMMDWDL